MMNVETKQIKSNADPTDNHPWYDVSVAEGVLSVDLDGDGGHKPDLTDESIQIGGSTDSVVAVEQDGGLVNYPTGSDSVPPLRAHLAWYDSETDTITVLEFVEE